MDLAGFGTFEFGGGGERRRSVSGGDARHASAGARSKQVEMWENCERFVCVMESVMLNR